MYRHRLAAAPIALVLFFGLLLFVEGPAHPSALHPATIARLGTFVTITDVGARDLAGNKTNDDAIERFRLSADGSTAVYAMTQSPLVGCAFTRQIRRVDIATGADVLIGGCSENLRFELSSFDVSDDGSKIVYIREDTSNQPELVLCQFAAGACTKTVLLGTIATGAATLWMSPNGADGSGSLVLSGDGTKVFFRNNFGPSDISRFATVTMYRVSLGAPGVATALFRFPDLATVPVLTSGTNFIAGFHQVDFTGTTMVFDSRASSGVGWHDVAMMDTTVGLTSVRSIAKNTVCCLGAGPAISSDGRTVAYNRGPGNPPPNQTSGLHVQKLASDLSPAGSPVVVDSDAVAIHPCLAGDGATVGLWDDTAGGDWHVRMVAADGSQLRNVTQPAVELFRPVTHCGLQSDGSRLLVYGTIRRAGGNTAFLPRELLLFRWATALTAPSVSSISAEPTEWFARDRFTLQPRMFHKFFWQVAVGASGGQVDRAYTAFLDLTAQESADLRGENNFSGFFDDGSSNDAQAGDGIYTGDFLSVEDDYPGSRATLRLGVASSVGTATHVDVDVEVFADAIVSALVSSVGTSPVAIGTTGVSLSFDANESGEITAQHFGYAPPHSLGTTTEFWRIFSGKPQGFFGGNGITSAPYVGTFSFDYNPSLVAPAGFDEAQLSLWRTLDGLSWEQIPSTLDTVSDRLTTAVGLTDVDGLWAVGGGTPVAAATIFTDGFESGDVARWSS